MTAYAFLGDKLRMPPDPRAPGAFACCDGGAQPIETFASFVDGAHVGVFDLAGAAPVPGGLPLMGLRDCFDCVTPQRYADIQRAFQLMHWRRTHRFCGACGRPLERKPIECAMTCTVCRLDVFPRVNPVVITRITRGDRILLARRARGVLRFFSVIAGFVEAGETLEQAVSREIREEVGIEVAGMRYFASQPWPFPNNLMIGFTAEHASGDIRVDGEEIGEAGWFDRGGLPPIPHPISISRWMIDDYLRSAGSR